MCAVDHGVNEGEPNEEYTEQYREPEPENEYREQELPEGFENGKFNLILWCIFVPVLKTQPIGLFYKTAYALTAENMVG